MKLVHIGKYYINADNITYVETKHRSPPASEEVLLIHFNNIATYREYQYLSANNVADNALILLSPLKEEFLEWLNTHTS